MLSGYCPMQPYITMLGTKAYSWGCAPSVDGSEEEGEKYETQRRRSPRLRSRRTVSLHRRGWYPSSLLQTDENTGDQAAKVGVVRGKNDEAPATLPSGGSFYDLSGDWSHLRPTTVVVPPVVFSNAVSAPPPLSVFSQASPDVLQPKLTATFDSSLPVLVEPYTSGVADRVLKNWELPPKEATTTPIRQTGNEVTSHEKVLSQTLGAAAPPPAFLPHVDRENVVKNVPPCSHGNHQYMLEGGFVYCPECGFKLRYDAPVEYVMEDCPMLHERESEGAAAWNKRDQYCVLCGTLIIYRVPSHQTGKLDVIGDAFHHQPQHQSSLVPSVESPISKRRPFTPPLDPVVKTKVFPSAILEELQGVAKCSPSMYSTAAGGVTKNGNQGNIFSLFSTPGAVRPIDEFLRGAPITKAMTVNGSKLNECSDVGPNASVEAKVVSALSASTVAEVATTTAEALPKVNKAVSCSPCDLEVNSSLEKASSAKVHTSAVATNAEYPEMVSSSTLQPMQYSCGVPGVSCGLPGCFLCLHSKPPPSHPVNVTSLGSPRKEASVVVVHNHYYHHT